jgi:hypothetical protein
MNDLEAITAAKATIVKSIHQANQLSVA